MPEQMSELVNLSEIETRAFEDQLLAAKTEIQVRLVTEAFGEQSEETYRIIAWISKYAATIDAIFHENRSLVAEFTSNPNGVFETVKSKLEK